MKNLVLIVLLGVGFFLSGCSKQVDEAADATYHHTQGQVDKAKKGAKDAEDAAKQRLKDGENAIKGLPPSEPK